MDISKLRPFRGYHSSLIPVSSGCYFRISNWSNSPTEFGPFTNLWEITPEDRRIAYCDPPLSSGVLCTYHDFHEVNGARLTFRWSGENDLRVTVEAENGTQVDLEISVEDTMGSRLLGLISRGTPLRLLVTPVMLRFSEFLSDLLVMKGRTQINGRTETGRASFAGKVERVRVVREVLVTKDGKDLGRLCRPTNLIRFGDFVPTEQAVIVFGTLYLE